MLLSIDPGHWTGWALVTEHPTDREMAQVIAMGQFQYHDIAKHLVVLQQMSQLLGVREWLVESTPDVNPDTLTLDIIGHVLGAAADIKVNVHRLKPFQWKYMEKLITLPSIKHSADASKMGLLWISRLKSD